jgi:hypothetical protein
MAWSVVVQCRNLPVGHLKSVAVWVSTRGSTICRCRRDEEKEAFSTPMLSTCPTSLWLILTT